MNRGEGFPQDFYTTKADRFDEIPGKEVGVEYKMPKETDADAIAHQIFEVFNNIDNFDFKIADSLPEIAESKTKQIRYREKLENSKRKLFTIVLRESDGAILYKKKSDNLVKGSLNEREETEYQLPYIEWDQDAEEEFLDDQSKVLDFDKENVKRKEIKKRKLKVRVENTSSKRIYTIGINEKINQKGKAKIEVKVEYVGRETPSGAVDTNADLDIASDIEKIASNISSIVN